MKPFNKTHTFIKRLADHISFGKIAAACGKGTSTAEAWGREPETNETPYGTGKRNPLDGVNKIIALAHKEDPGLAREIAEIFPDYVDFLDGKCGTVELVNVSINEIVANSAKEHMDVVLEVLKTAQPDWDKVIAECRQAEAALNTVLGYARNQIGK